MSSNEIDTDDEPLSKRTKCDHPISKESLGIIEEESEDSVSHTIQPEHISSQSYVPPESVLIKGEPSLDLEIPETVVVKCEPEAILVAPVETKISFMEDGKDPTKLTLEELGLKIEEDEEFMTPGCSLNITLFAGTKKVKTTPKLKEGENSSQSSNQADVTKIQKKSVSTTSYENPVKYVGLGNLKELSKTTKPIDIKTVSQIQCYRCPMKIAYEDFPNHLTSLHNLIEPEEELERYEKALLNPQIETIIGCLYCKGMCTDVHCLMTHCQKEHGLCHVCGVKFDLNRAPKHIQSHEIGFNYIVRCYACTNLFPSKVLFINHCRTEHAPVEGEPPCTILERVHGLGCAYCFFGTDTIQTLLFHLQLHKHSTCELCERPYMPTAKHISDGGFRKCEKCEPIHFLKLPNRSHFLRDLPCPLCPEMLLDGVKFYIHIIQIHRCCLVCGTCFINNVELTKHQKTCNRFIYKCSACHMKFNNIVTHFHTMHSDITYKYDMVSFNSEFDVDKILTNSQCCYCLRAVNPSTFEKHLEQVHKVVRCINCTGFKFKNAQCKKCPLLKARRLFLTKE